MIFRFLAVVLGATVISGCAQFVDSQEQELSRLRLVARRINNVPLAPGVIYSSAKASRRFDVVLDFVALNVVGNRVGRLVASEDFTEPIDLGVFALGDPVGLCDPKRQYAASVPKSLCGPPTNVNVELRPKSVTKNEILDGLAILEVLNRPVSGLVYNESAERKIMQWRAALAGAGGSQRIYLCIKGLTMTSGEIVIRGRLSLEQARRIVNLINYNHAFPSVDEPSSVSGDSQTEYTFPITGAVQYEALLSEIVFVETSSFPRIELTTGGRRTVSILDQR